jgi:hypothetical protein
MEVLAHTCPVAEIQGASELYIKNKLKDEYNIIIYTQNE